MAKFRVNFCSVEWCGFDSQFVIEAENEDAIWEDELFQEKYDEQYDWILEHADEWDVDEWDDDDPDEVGVDFEEITDEEYNEEKEWQ
jgi:hypothetical protein